MNPVIVHGGGPAINENLKLRNIESNYINGLRVTTPEIMDVVEMVLTGQVAPELTSHFNKNDVKAVSVSGKDAKTLQAQCVSEELGLVGEVNYIDPTYINHLIENDYVPIISPIAYGENGESLNINSDDAASAIAQALNAYKLILITDVDGVYKDFEDPDSLIDLLDIEDIKEATEEGVISGGMIPKLNCCVNAVIGGVERCHIINGTKPQALLLELFTSNGIGTMIIERRIEDYKRKGLYYE